MSAHEWLYPAASPSVLDDEGASKAGTNDDPANGNYKGNDSISASSVKSVARADAEEAVGAESHLLVEGKSDSASIKSGGLDETEHGTVVAPTELSNPDGVAERDMKNDIEVGEKTAGEATIKLENEQESAKNPGSSSKAFFTNEVRVPSLNTIHEHGCIILKFSDYADLFAKVTGPDGRTYVFEVQSDVLAAASTVFHEMVYGSHKRGGKEGWQENWVWELSDKPMGLKVLFSLLHHRYRETLFVQDPQPRQVYDVLRTFVKYGVSDDAFQPWVKSWVTGFRRGLSGSTLTNLESLYASHKLGDFKSFKLYIRKVAHDVEIGENGAVLLDGKPIQEVVPVTDQLVANVRAVRLVDLKALLDPLQIAYECLMGDDDGAAADYCKSTDGHDECNEKLLGSLLGSLRRHKLRPIPSADTYNGSVGILARNISEMEIRGLYVPNLTPHHQRHGLCKIGQNVVAQQLLQGKAYVSMYDDLVEEMVLTAKRAGIAKLEKGEFQDYKAVFNAASVKYHEEFRNNFWGWAEGTESNLNELLFHTDDSAVGPGCVSK
ncbi:unnamed protein product [Discula destructiva]